MKANPVRGVVVGIGAALLNGGLALCLGMASPDCEGEANGIKGEFKPINIEANGVKLDVHLGASEEAKPPPGMDERAGQKGATEYEGTPQHGCLADGKTCW